MRGLSARAAGDDPSRPWSVLLVEADPQVRASVSHQLGEQGCAVVGVPGIAAAVTRLMVPDRDYDVVVTDLGDQPRAPGGVPAVGVLAAVGPTPIIVWTGDTGQGTTEAVMAAGATAVVAREDGVAGLVEVIARIAALHPADLAALPSASRDLAGRADFHATLRRVLHGLQERIPLGLWMLTRVDGDDWVVIDAVGDAYDIRPGAVLRWSESFCSRMVRGQGPRIVQAVEEGGVYADAAIARQIPIGCYVGMPIAIEGRGLFGTLCAIDPDPSDLDLSDVRWAIELLATTLSSALAIELERRSLARRLRAPDDRDVDALTGMAGPRTWRRLLRLEEARSSRTGEPAAIVMLDVRGVGRVNEAHGHAAGDALLRRAATAIQQALAVSEIAVHLGGGRFGVLTVGRGPDDVDRLAEDLVAGLSAAGIDAAVGLAGRDGGITLEDAALLATDLVEREKTRSEPSDEQRG